MPNLINIKGEYLKATQLIDQSISPYSVMNSFSLDFTDDDHKLKNIGLMHVTNGISTTFSDHNGDDTYNASITYLILDEWASELHRSTYSGLSDNVSSMKISFEPDYVPLIQGFKMEFSDGNDHHISQISVRIEDLLIDNNANTEYALRTAMRDHNQVNKYNYEVQIIWAPKDRFSIINRRYFDYGLSPTTQIKDVGNDHAYKALQGFRMSYLKRNLLLTDNALDGKFIKYISIYQHNSTYNGSMSDKNKVHNAIEIWPAILRE